MRGARSSASPATRGLPTSHARRWRRRRTRPPTSWTAAAADGVEPALIRIDGGMSANDWFAQTLADIVGVSVERPAVTETTAWGAAVLAGLGVGAFSDPAEVPRPPGRRFSPQVDPAPARARWADAVARTLTRRG